MICKLYIATTASVNIMQILVSVIMLLAVFSCRGSTGGPDSSEQVDNTDVAERVGALVQEACRAMDEGHLNQGFSLIRDAEAAIETASPGSVAGISHRDMYLLHVYKGNIYVTYRDFRLAARCYDRAIGYAGTPIDSAKMLLNLSVVSSLSGDSVGAATSIARLHALEIPDSSYKKYAHAVAMAYAEKNFGSRPRSLSYFKKSLDICRHAGMDKHLQLTPVSEIYEYYNTIENLDSMLSYLQYYKSLAERYMLPEMMADVDKGFMRAYIMLGDRDKAIDAFDSYFNIVDSLYNPADFSALNTRYNDEDMSRANDKVMLLKLTLTRQKILFYAVVTALLAAAATWLIYRWARQSQVRILYLNREIARNETGSSSVKPKHFTDSSSERHSKLMDSIYDALSEPAVYCDPEFNISTLARLVSSNTKYVSQAINESTGMNFRSFINSLRIKVARVRLTSGEYSGMTIQYVSESVGFKSTSNFVVAFKKIMGVTPSAYQKLARQNTPLSVPAAQVTDN